MLSRLPFCYSHTTLLLPWPEHTLGLYQSNLFAFWAQSIPLARWRSEDWKLKANVRHILISINVTARCLFFLMSISLTHFVSTLFKLKVVKNFSYFETYKMESKFSLVLPCLPFKEIFCPQQEYPSWLNCGAQNNCLCNCCNACVLLRSGLRPASLPCSRRRTKLWSRQEVW